MIPVLARFARPVSALPALVATALAALLAPGPASAGSGYMFSNIENCYMAAAASQDFTEADCDAAWQQAVANNRLMAKVEVCDASSGPRCGADPMLSDMATAIAAGIAAGHLLPQVDPLGAGPAASGGQ